MNKTDVPVLPTPPSLMASLMAGFDAIATHLPLIMFPVALDLLLWLGPHVRVKKLAETFAAQLVEMSSAQGGASQEWMQTSQEMWLYIGEHLNLLSLLRSYPVGIPSLLVAKQPVAEPFGQPLYWDVPSLGWVFFLMLVFTVVGLVVASLYYRSVADAALQGKVFWREVFARWPWSATQVGLLSLFWYLLALGVSIPSLCLLSLLVMGGAAVSGIGFFIFGGLLLWLLFPLLLSGHGIFVYGISVASSIKRGIKLVRMTLPATGLFFVMLMLVGEGLEVVWQLPDETSWMLIIGVLGHAFVTTGLLAASFIYYRDADQWVQNMQAYWKQQPTARLKS